MLDPGHGGDDLGAEGPGGTKEKDYVLQIARRLKAAIENRIGLRVLLTRDSDENVPVDKRMALANNNKADLFISLHVNGAVRPETQGTQVLSLRADDYKARTDQLAAEDVSVPIEGGGTRPMAMVPWDIAQLPFAARSAALAGALVSHLSARGVPLFARPTQQLPLRPLVGANMPAIMIEMGFLTSDKDEQALNGAERSGAIIEAILETIADARRGLPAPEAH